MVKRITPPTNLPNNAMDSGSIHNLKFWDWTMLKDALRNDEAVYMECIREIPSVNVFYHKTNHVAVMVAPTFVPTPSDLNDFQGTKFYTGRAFLLRTKNRDGDYYALYAPMKLDAERLLSTIYTEVGVWAFRKAWWVGFESALEAVCHEAPGLYEITLRRIPAVKNGEVIDRQTINIMAIFPVMDANKRYEVSHKFTVELDSTPNVADAAYITKACNFNIDVLFDESDQPRNAARPVEFPDANILHLCIERQQYVTDLNEMKNAYSNQMIRHKMGIKEPKA
jgi:hypothetical protein